MKIGGRLQGAIEILHMIDINNLPASESLKEWGRTHRFAGSKDRAFIGNVVYDALRLKLFLAWAMDSDAIEDIAFASLYYSMGLELDTLIDLLKDDKFSNYVLKDEQYTALSKKKFVEAPNFIKANMPSWLFEKLECSFKDQTLLEAIAMTKRPPLDLRVNLLKASFDKVLKALKPLKSLQSIDWFPQALRIPPSQESRNHPNVQIEPAFQKGWFEIQDLGSQLIAYLAYGHAEREAQGKSLQILDYCAGAGGKTLAIAPLMKNKGQIHAYDKEKSRIAPIFARLQRANVRNSQIYTSLDALEELYGKMDLVICDAPCTGSGTWRRHPDAKWRLKAQQIQKRLQDQQEILSNVCSYIKVGKFLAYMTCSLFEEENDFQIKAFLEKNKNFSLISLKPLWHKLMSDKAPLPLFTAYGALFSPYATKTDGFYLAILQKDY